ncbi:MAG: hypothetical protein HY922_07430 [Elusimicrobia bacterium]|nr:hypothetical protein [Elusimicrobiota bacterium]
MRRIADAARIRAFMSALAGAAEEEARIYFTGGATAVLMGWRGTTIDVDIKVVPERDALLREIPKLKDSLRINVELASPDLFIPALDGWEERSPFIAREGRLSFHHYDLYAQALAKLERGHQQDLEDARQMLSRGLIEPGALMRRYESIEPRLYRYPAVDPAAFRRSVEEFLRGPSDSK